MERDHKRQKQSDVAELNLQHRYREIGISAVKAAAVGYSEKQTCSSGVGNRTGKQQTESGHKGKLNLGQREASQEKQKDAERRHVGELSRNAEQGGMPARRKRGDC